MHTMKGWALVVWIGCVLVPAAQGMFMRQQTENVPIQRLFINLEARVARDRNDLESTYCLARLHSMAYAQNLQTFQVNTQNNKPVFGFPGSDAGVPKKID